MTSWEDYLLNKHYAEQEKAELAWEVACERFEQDPKEFCLILENVGIDVLEKNEEQLIEAYAELYMSGELYYGPN